MGPHSPHVPVAFVRQSVAASGRAAFFALTPVLAAMIILFLGVIAMLQHSKARQITLLGVLIALQTVLGSMFSLQFLLTKISFGFIITAIMATLFSPWVTAGSSALANILGMLLFPKFTFSPGFVLTAFLVGLVFGYAFHNQTPRLSHILLSNLIVTMVLYLGLNSLWLHLMYQTPWLPLLSGRFVQELITFPVYSVLLFLLFKVSIVRSTLQKYA
ncbi:folate family ECF transporter S component [Loigolactobacillus coryniformis]|uniref:Folate family ECF transporter S component n=1 Tax=Loigolactobacillus coryniformis TaxID=1610 RepID=A0A5B8TM43_9LACO|nr:folate family ECF transporter S component [Loigolactobacillus coryniformis]QEA52934.1 folate family ECF transporter S component [Loigolactobacillus coryniformis]